jgi:hypothetical protein
MKVQTGVRIESEVWAAYKAVCAREKLRPSRPIEDFLRLVVDDDSALSVLRMIREAARSRVDGIEAYARVLLDWYLHGKLWLSVSEKEESVEALLLDSLKVVVDPDLRRRIEEELVAHQRRISEKRRP